MMKTYLILSSLIMYTYGTNDPSISDRDKTTSIESTKYTTVPSEIEKEKAEIKGPLKHITGPPLTETLLEMLAHEKIQRREEASAEKTIISLSCAKLFRYRMDIFGIEFGHQGNKRGKDCPSFKTALNAIKGALHKRKLNLCFAVQELIELYQNFSDKGNTFSDFSPQELSIWESKAKSACNHIKKVSLHGNQNEKILPECDKLINLIRHIHSAKNENEALTVFKKHCEFKFWSVIKFSAFDDNPEIEKLVYELPPQERRYLIDDYNKRSKGNLAPEDCKFLHDYIEYGNASYFVKNDKHFQGCVEVFYYADPYSIKPLNDDLEKKWKTLPFPLRVVRFCIAYAQLYNLLSVTNMHAPSDSTALQCMMSSNDFKNFFNGLTATHYRKDDFVVVAEVFQMM